MSDNLPTIPEVGLTPDVEQKLTTELVFTEGVASQKPMTLIERAICEMRADRKTNISIATYLGISLNEVKRVLAKEHVREFLKELINAQYDMSKEYRLEMLDKIIQAKLEELGDDLKGATKKDIVDLLLIQDSMLKEREKKTLGTNEDTYITLLQQIVKQ